MTKPLVAALLCAFAVSSATAQAVYRCGNAYSRVPCAAGDARLVESTDPRSAAQRAEARRVADDERRLAADMRRERLEDQRALKPAGASSLSGAPTPAAKAASAAPRPAPKKHKRATAGGGSAGDDFVALDPTSRASRSSR